MKKLAKLTAAAVLVLGFAGAAQAGGASDSSGDGFHCYMFFEKEQNGFGAPFAQVMINDSDDEEVEKKRTEAISKWVADFGLTLTAYVGNLGNDGDFLEPSVCHGALFDGDLLHDDER